MTFQFSDGEFSDPIPTSLKMWKKIDSFIVLIALFVTLEKLNRNPQACPPFAPKFALCILLHTPHSKTCCAVPATVYCF